jgi:hypothetical protein
MKNTHRQNTSIQHDEDDDAHSIVPRNKGGAPKGNTNAARHYMQGGQLPKEMRYIEHRVNAFRRHLEEAVTSNKGEITITDGAAINSALKWERHGLLAQHWLRREADKLSAGDRLKFSEHIAKASDQRDKNLRLLGLDTKKDPWEGVFDGTILDE